MNDFIMQVVLDWKRAWENGDTRTKRLHLYTKEGEPVELVAWVGRCELVVSASGECEFKEMVFIDVDGQRALG